MQRAIVEKRPIDPDFMRVIKIIEKKTPSEIAKGGMVGASTIRNWRKGGVRRPAFYTTQAALRACGYEWKIGRFKGE